MVDNLLQEFDKTEANALVIDFKDDFGRVVCETESPLINQLGSTKVYIEDMAGLMFYHIDQPGQLLRYLA